MGSPSLISIILHVGKIISTLKDFEKTVGDAVAKQNVTEDLKRDLQDVVDLVSAGLLSIPGLTAEQVAGVAADIQKL